MKGETIDLWVPGRPEMMLVVRLSTAGVLARSGLTIEAMEDVKMAAEEACGCLIRGWGCGRLHIGYQLSQGQLAMWVEARDWGADCAGVSDQEACMTRCVLLSMMDQAELCYEDGRLTAIRMGKLLPR